MAKYIGKKLIYMVLLVVAASMLCFLLMKASPVDPFQTDVGRAALGSMSEQQMTTLRANWGAEGSWWQQYLTWAKAFLGGDMGTSLYYRQPVSQIIGSRLPNSLLAIGIAWLISGVVGFFAGAAAGLNKGRGIDKLVKGYCLAISSTTASWVALVVVLVFVVWLRCSSIRLSVPVEVDSLSVTFADRVRQAILPALTLSIMGMLQIARFMRGKMLALMDSDVMRLAVERGEKGVSLFYKHGGKQIILPALALHLTVLGELCGGAILVEQVFSYPGMGQAAVTAGMSCDLPLLCAIAMISVLFVFCSNTIADILSHLADLRTGKGGDK